MYLEFVHDRYYFIFQSFVGDLPPAQVDFVAYQNDGDLSKYKSAVSSSRSKAAAYIYPQLTEMGQPISRYSVE